MRLINILFCITCLILIGCSSASKISGEDRVVNAWPQVRQELNHAAELAPIFEDSERKQILEITSQIDKHVSLKNYESIIGIWEKQGCGETAFLGINWAYRGDSANTIREWARWHIREFEKSLAVVGKNEDFKKTVKWQYGTLKKTTIPPHPVIQ